MGGDRELVMFSIPIAATSILRQWKSRPRFGVALWIFALFALRLMAKHDPQLRRMYLRQLRYKILSGQKYAVYHQPAAYGKAVPMITAITILIAVLGALLLDAVYAHP